MDRQEMLPDISLLFLVHGMPHYLNSIIFNYALISEWCVIVIQIVNCFKIYFIIGYW